MVEYFSIFLYTGLTWYFVNEWNVVVMFLISWLESEVRSKQGVKWLGWDDGTSGVRCNCVEISIIRELSLNYVLFGFIGLTEVLNFLKMGDKLRGSACVLFILSDVFKIISI